MVGTAGTVPGGAKGSEEPPTVAWNALTPGRPRTRFSTVSVSALVWASVELSGMVRLTGKFGLEDWSSRLIRSKGVNPSDPKKMAPAATRVMARWLVAQRMTGM